jgi:hypothetical protein
MAFHHLFTEPMPGYIAHSAGSKVLASNEIVRAGLGQSFNDFYPSFARVCKSSLVEFGDVDVDLDGGCLADVQRS